MTIYSEGRRQGVAFEYWFMTAVAIQDIFFSVTVLFKHSNYCVVIYLIFKNNILYM